MNRILFDFAFLERALASGGWERVGSSESGVESIVIDSRKACPGAFFVPLKGENTDGHRFIEDVLAKKAAGSFVSRQWFETDGADLRRLEKEKGFVLYVVEDPLTSLQDLAAAFRAQFEDLYLIGITGSNGKTTTKEILSSLLSQKAPTVCNEGNLNSEIGLPLSVFRITREHRYAVLEMGMNHEGEMLQLARVARPNAALITNIGTAHIGRLGSRDNIALEKKNIFKYFDDKCLGFVPEDESYKDFLMKDIPGTFVEFGEKTTPGFRGAVGLGLLGYDVDLDGTIVRFPLAGFYNLKNALAAVAAAEKIGLSFDEIRRGLAEVKPEFGRGEILEGRLTVIRDCYNANPDSVKNSLEMFGALDFGGKKIAVLGDMLELGEESPDAHARIGGFVGSLDLDAVFFFGPEMKAAESAARERGGGCFFWTDDYIRLKEELLSRVKEGDVVLLKGSRGMKLERLTDPLLAV